MSFNNILYNGLVFIAFVLSLVVFFNNNKRFGVLSILLISTFLVEIIVLILIKKKIDFTWLYHLFNLLEYCLFSLFLVKSVKSKNIIRAVRLSIFFFILTGFSISFFFYHFKGFPGININIEGFLLSLLCIYILFNLDVDDNTPILRNSDFWICSGILIFFGCTFFFNGILTKILQIGQDKALKLFGIIHKPLNIILYSFIIIGILCLITKKKLIIPF